MTLTGVSHGAEEGEEESEARSQAAATGFRTLEGALQQGPRPEASPDGAAGALISVGGLGYRSMAQRDASADLRDRLAR